MSSLAVCSKRDVRKWRPPCVYVKPAGWAESWTEGNPEECCSFRGANVNLKSTLGASESPSSKNRTNIYEVIFCADSFFRRVRVIFDRVCSTCSMLWAYACRKYVCMFTWAIGIPCCGMNPCGYIPICGLYIIPGCPPNC